MSVSSLKIWKTNNPDRVALQKKRNYKKGDYSGNLRCFWSPDEIPLIMSRDMTDRDLAQELGRSVQAIQVKRSRLKARKR